VWFRDAGADDGLTVGDGAGVELHVGVEEPFAPARRAHSGFHVDDVDAVATACAAAGHEVTWDDALPGYRRYYTADGHGNRVEVLGDA